MSVGPGLELVFLGTVGGPLLAKRRWIATALIVGSDVYLVDAGLESPTSTSTPTCR